MSSAPPQSAMAELERAALRVWRKISAPGAPCRVVVSVGSAGPKIISALRRRA